MFLFSLLLHGYRILILFHFVISSYNNMSKAGKDSPLQDLSLCQTMICYSHNRLKCISSKMVYLVQHHGLKRATVKNKKHSQTNLHEYQYS